MSAKMAKADRLCAKHSVDVTNDDRFLILF